MDRYIQESNQKLDVDKYLNYCEQLGIEPDPDKMPLDASTFPGDVQVAFFMFSLLPDSWDTNSGTYMGKNWNTLDLVFDMYEVVDRKYIFHLMKIYENLLVEYHFKEAERKRKAAEKKQSAAGGGPQYAHRVQG